jgi:hypothetical protein
MKTTIQIITVLLIFTSTIMLAGETRRLNAGNTSTSGITINILKLSPTTPAVADFSDGTDLVPATDATISRLSPSTPAEADFSDTVNDSAAGIAGLAPETPVEADFTD